MNKRVLLFESFADNIMEALKGAFQHAGFETCLEIRFADCLERIRQTQPGVVVMLTNNVKEGDLRAFASAEAIRRVHPTCGFVFLTANFEGDDGAESLAAGYQFERHQIPISMSELMSLTHAAFESPASTFVIPQPPRDAGGRSHNGPPVPKIWDVRQA